MKPNHFYINLVLILVFSLQLKANEFIDSLNMHAEKLLFENTNLSKEYSTEAINYLYQNNLKKINAVESWVNYANALYIEKQYHNALDTLGNAIGFINLIDNKKLVARLLNLYSKTHKELRNDTVSLKSYYSQVWNSNDTINIQRTGASLREIGNYYLKSGNLEKSLFYYQKYLSWVEMGSDSVSMANAYHLIGIVYQSLIDPDKALLFYKKALDLKKRNPDINNRGKTINNIGAIYLLKQEYDSAIYYIEKANEIFKEDSNLKDLCKNYANLGIAFDNQRKFENALYYYHKALGIAIEINDNNELAICYLNLGGIHYTMQKYKQSLNYFSKAAIHAEKTTNIILKSRIKFGKSVIYEILGDNTKALFELKEHLNLQDSVFSISSTKQIAEMDAKYELERKDQEIENLNKDREIQDLRLKQKKSQTILLLAVLGAIAIILTLIIYMFLQRGKTNKQLSEINAIIQEQNEELNIINDELQNINRQLLSSEEKLRASNKTKEKLLSIIAHDIKNPLLAAKSFIVLIKQKSQVFTKEQIAMYAEILESSVVTIGELLNNLLYWGRTQKQGSKIKIEVVNINTIFTKNIKLLEAWSNQKKIKFVYDANDPVLVKGEDHMIDFIIRNLLSNAIKFSHENSNIEIKLAEKDSEIKISIKDFGIGMSSEAIQKIKQKSEQFISIGTNNEKGTGLGLSICQEFALKMNTEINIESDLGKGSTFSFLLPNAQ